MNLVFIYGPPAADKLSVATELAALTGYTLFHNHVSIDFVKPIFAWGTPSFGRTVEALRLLIIEEAARVNLPGMIFTLVYAYPHDTSLVERLAAAVERHGGNIYLVQLVCDPEVLEARVGAASRTSYGKITSADTLRELLDQHDLFTPVPGRSSLSFDTTTFTPHEAAQRIRTHYHL